MTETKLTGIAISVEMLEKRFAKKKIAAKLEKALKSQKKRTKKLLKEVKEFAQESGQNPDQLIKTEFPIRLNLMVYVINTSMTMLLSNEKEDSLDDLILCLLTEENAKWNIEAFEGKLHTMREDYKLYLNQEKFNSMCEEGGYPYNNGGGYLSQLDNLILKMINPDCQKIDNQDLLNLDYYHKEYYIDFLVPC